MSLSTYCGKCQAKSSFHRTTSGLVRDRKFLQTGLKAAARAAMPTSNALCIRGCPKNLLITLAVSSATEKKEVGYSNDEDPSDMKSFWRAIGIFYLLNLVVFLLVLWTRASF